VLNVKKCDALGWVAWSGLRPHTMSIEYPLLTHSLYTWQQTTTVTITICYYYLQWHLILILQPHGR